MLHESVVNTSAFVDSYSLVSLMLSQSFADTGRVTENPVSYPVHSC